MVFPVLEKLEEGTCQWDFYLLTEEEVRGSLCAENFTEIFWILWVGSLWFVLWAV